MIPWEPFLRVPSWVQFPGAHVPFAPLPPQPWSAPAAGVDIPAPADSWEQGSEEASAWDQEWAAEHSGSPLEAPPSPTPSPPPPPAGEVSGSNSKNGARHSQHHGKKSLGAFFRMNWLQNACSAEALPLSCQGLILHSWISTIPLGAGSSLGGEIYPGMQVGYPCCYLVLGTLSSRLDFTLGKANPTFLLCFCKRPEDSLPLDRIWKALIPQAPQPLPRAHPGLGF